MYKEEEEEEGMRNEMTHCNKYYFLFIIVCTDHNIVWQPILYKS